MLNVNTFLNLFGIAAMVAEDTGLPDPDNPDNDFTVANEGIILVTEDEDSDDQETIVLDEYQPLSMEDTGDFNSGSSDDEAHEIDNHIRSETTSSDTIPVPPITPIEHTLVKEVWSMTPSQDFEMDSKKIDEVKQAMLNVTLPPTCIPEWAANIPEGEWKQQLMKRLQTMKGESSS